MQDPLPPRHSLTATDPALVRLHLLNDQRPDARPEWPIDEARPPRETNPESGHGHHQPRTHSPDEVAPILCRARAEPLEPSALPIAHPERVVERASARTRWCDAVEGILRGADEIVIAALHLHGLAALVVVPFDHDHVGHARNAAARFQPSVEVRGDAVV